MVVVDAPLLIEAGWHSWLDYLIVVKASLDLQIRRLSAWVEFEFLPTVTTSGIRALAFLPSTDAAHRLCIQMLSHLANTILPAQIHLSETAARVWLAAYVA